MGHPPQQWREACNDVSWLSTLVESLEEACRPGCRAVVCDPAVLAALMAQLAQPVAPRGRSDRNIRFLH
jgi:hypothetical protein